MREPGRIKIRLAEMLAQAGLDIQPEQLKVNYGYNTKHRDGCSWTGQYKTEMYGHLTYISIYSWEQMSVLVRKGIEVEQEDNQRYCIHSIEKGQNAKR